jgi:long-chain acyl-CoA synthetase
MLFESLFKHADARPHEIAVTDDTGSYSWQQLAAAAAGLGMYLSVQTDRPRVGLLLPTGMGFAASFYGTLLAGKTVVPINFLLGEKEVQHIIKDSDIDTIVSIPLLSARLKDTPLKIVDLQQLQKMAPPPGAVTPKFPDVKADDLCVLMYTSGTSGLPKGVQISYGNLSSDVDSAIEHAQLKGSHRFLGIVPLFHSTGLLATLVAPVKLGAQMVYQARFSPTAVMKAIREQQISLVVAVPSMYGALARLKEAGPDDVKSLYAAISGGEPLPSNIRDAWQKKFGIPIYEGYGLTETIGPIAFNVPGAIKGGAVGKIIPNAEVRITDEEGKGVPNRGDTGEVWLRGPMIMKGYHNLPDETAKAMTADGYFKTGDLGHIDPEGYLHITGRKKGHHHRRRGEGGAARDRGSDHASPVGGGRGGGRQEGPEPGRSRRRVRDRKAGSADQTRRDPRLLPAERAGASGSARARCSWRRSCRFRRREDLEARVAGAGQRAAECGGMTIGPPPRPGVSGSGARMPKYVR